MCSLLDDLSAPTHQRSSVGSTTYDGGRPVIPNFPSDGIEPQGEMATRTRRPAPLALMTTGWDDSGSPFAEHRWSGCATKIIELPRVVRWFVSHHQGPDPGPKVRAMSLAVDCFLDPEGGQDVLVPHAVAAEPLTTLHPNDEVSFSTTNVSNSFLLHSPDGPVWRSPRYP